MTGKTVGFGFLLQGKKDYENSLYFLIQNKHLCIVRSKKTKMDLPNTSVTDAEGNINVAGIIPSSPQKIQLTVLEAFLFLP